MNPNDNWALLGSYAASGGNSLPTFREKKPIGPETSVRNWPLLAA
jgi:hypothetical protein